MFVIRFSVDEQKFFCLIIMLKRTKKYFIEQAPDVRATFLKVTTTTATTFTNHAGALARRRRAPYAGQPKTKHETNGYLNSWTPNHSALYTVVLKHWPYTHFVIPVFRVQCKKENFWLLSDLFLIIRRFRSDKIYLPKFPLTNLFRARSLILVRWQTFKKLD